MTPDLARVAWECLRSGTLASLAMMPFGGLARALGLRVGHYGPKFAQLWVEDPGPVFLFAQHLVLGWLSAVPLFLVFAAGGHRRWIAWGLVYGAGYYAAVNGWALPVFFGDPLPWQLGPAVVAPSLVVHLVYGAVLGWGWRRWVARAHLPQPPAVG